MKKNYKLIKFLKSAGKYYTLSKYGAALEKIFQKKCVKSLINSLSKEKIVSAEDIFNEKFESKNLSKITSYENGINEKCLLDYNHEDYLKRQKEIIENNINKKKIIEPWSINEKTPRLPMPKTSFDSYKYNPKYDIIYKRIPSFSFIKSAKNAKRTDNQKKPSIIINIKKIKCSKSNNNKYKKILNIKTQTNIKIKNKYLPFLTSINSDIFKKNNIIPKKEKNNNSYNKKNHCKNDIIDSLTNQKKNVSKSNLKPYYESRNSIVNYQKMTSRNQKNLIYEYNAYTPSVWFYSPKYDFIKPHSRIINFNPPKYKDKKKYRNNKIIKRIMSSYNVSTEYLSVDNLNLGKISKF